MSHSKKVPSEVDLFVGERLKEARLNSGLTQSDLALKLGITFQQFQKYESGVNRITAGRLFEAAKILRIPPGRFYPDIDFEAKCD